MRSPLPLVVGVCLSVFALSASPVCAQGGKQPIATATGAGKQPITTAGKEPLPLLPSKNPVRLAPPPSPHGFFVRAGGGVEFPAGGEFTSDLSRCVWATGLGLPAQVGALNVDFDSLDFDDVYDEMYGGNVELGYDIAKRLAIYVGVGYLTGDANKVDIGTINGRSAYAEFDDYEAWRFYGGLRHSLGSGRSRWTPYVGAHAGVSFVEGIDGSYRSSGRHGVSTPDISLYDDSEVFFAGFTVGLSYAVTHNFNMGIESGMNFQDGLDEADDSIAGEPGLESLASGEGFWSIPVRIFGEYHF